MNQRASEVRQVLLSLLRLRQNNRLLRLEFPRKDGPADALMVPNELIAREAMSCDFKYTVTVLSEHADLVNRELIGKMVTISLVRDDGSLRHFNGHIFSLRFVKNDAGFCHYEMVLAPWMAFLRLTKNSFLFNGMTLQDQIAQLLSRYSMCDWRTAELDADEPMTDAFQFNESDYNYFHRRLEAKGWHYHYEHRADGHTMVISADSTRCDPIDGGGELIWRGADNGVKASGVQSFSTFQAATANLYTATRFDFKIPGVSIAQAFIREQKDDLQTLEMHEHVGAYGFKGHKDGEQFARLRMEEIEARATHKDGSTNDARVKAGRSFKLRQHRDPLSQIAASDSDEFLILSATHTASNNYQPTNASVPQAETRYSNICKCIEKSVIWRPGRDFNSDNTKVHGIRTAIVVGHPTEEIYTDEFGRVRVQFPWDREDASTPVLLPG